jgi:colicin import membrane protein
MNFLPISDPRSFTIPVVVSTLIIAVVIGLLSTKWMNSEPIVIKSLPKISARLVQIKKNTPKQSIKKTKPAKKVHKKKPVVKAKKVTVNKKAKTPKPVKKAEKVIKKAQPKPVALPEIDLLAALLEEERQNALSVLLEDELLAQQADEEQEAIMSYIAQIQQLINSLWHYPPSAKHDDKLVLRIYLVPTGEIAEVQLVESSGNAALDRSAEQAVWKAVTLPVPKDPVLFEKEFRQFLLPFSPENARL